LDGELDWNVIGVRPLSIPHIPSNSLTLRLHTRGLALEALITILTTSFIPFFMILWIIGKCLVFLENLPVGL
jgi:hypothetical protein